MRFLASRGRPLINTCLLSLHHSRPFSVEAVSRTDNKTQVYISKSRNPFLNLSVEHFLLQTTPPESFVLLIYVNSPCVVIGRNQNPWLEANLSRLAQTAQRPDEISWKGDPVQLVRRRSGGGAVFHDGGNVNYCVISPPATFDRDRHAEMVVRALNTLGQHSVCVNERHDIVVHARDAGGGTRCLKVSGSAYKLTRLRSLHHGTCLLRSPNLSSISDILRSPAAPFIKARGIGSVRSQVTNLNLDNAEFEAAVIEQFSAMYGRIRIQAEFDDNILAIAKIRDGYHELRSKKWIFGQTPQFSFSTHTFSQDGTRTRPDLPFSVRGVTPKSNSFRRRLFVLTRSARSTPGSQAWPAPATSHRQQSH